MRKGFVLSFASTLLLCLLSPLSCTRRQHSISVPVLPPNQNYVDLLPQLRLRIENAYYNAAASRRGVEGFLGTEIAKYEVTAQGLQLLSVQPMKGRSKGQMPVQKIISTRQQRYRNYRLYYETVFTRNSRIHGSVLLGADSTLELDQLANRLVTPESVCNKRSAHCTVFPDACSVSVEMSVLVNGTPRTIDWGSVLASIVNSPKHVEIMRSSSGQLHRLEIDPRDPNTLRMPLLPGDQVTWN